MPPPSKSFTDKLNDKLKVNRLISNSNTAKKRLEADRMNINKYGQSYNSAHFKKLYPHHEHGKYGQSAASLNSIITRSQAKAKAAAKAKAEAEATLQKEAELQASILKQILGGKQQIAGYKKAKPKKK
jgi:hypothetical protein